MHTDRFSRYPGELQFSNNNITIYCRLGPMTILSPSNFNSLNYDGFLFLGWNPIIIRVQQNSGL